MRPRQSSLGILQQGAMGVNDQHLHVASMRPRQSSLGIGDFGRLGAESISTGCHSFNEAEAIKPRNPLATRLRSSVDPRGNARFNEAEAIKPRNLRRNRFGGRGNQVGTRWKLGSSPLQ